MPDAMKPWSRPGRHGLHRRRQAARHGPTRAADRAARWRRSAILAWGLVPAGPASGTAAAGPRGAAQRPAEPRRLRADGAGLLRTAARRRPAARRRGRAPAPVPRAGPCGGGRGRARPARARGRRPPRVRAQAEPDDRPRAADPLDRPTPSGMRDREYPIAKPPGTFRIAFVGDSIARGLGGRRRRGVRAEAGAEPSTSGRGRRGGRRSRSSTSPCRGTGPASAGTTSRRVGWAIAPDLVIFEATLADAGWDERRLRGLLPRGIGWDAPVYRDVLAAAGARPGGTPEAYKRGSAAASLGAAARGSTARRSPTAGRAGCRASWVLVPRVGKPADPAERDAGSSTLARDAGFAAVVDLPTPTTGSTRPTLAIGPNDFHPNAEGHARLARRLDAGAGPASPELERALDATRDRGRGTTGADVAMSHRPAEPPARPDLLRADARRAGPGAGPAAARLGGGAVGAGERPLARAQPRRPRGQRRRLLRGPDRRRRRPAGGARASWRMRLLGKPTDWVRFHAANVTRPLPDGDFLQFELKPNVHQHALRPAVHHQQPRHARPRVHGREARRAIFRIAVLGSSIDMGWGVGTEETYVNLLEDWLNAHAARRGLARRFEVLNFAVAAYSPMQRLEAFRRKARGVRARPGDLLGDDARHPADGDPPLRPVPAPTSTCPTTSSARRSPTPGSTADDLRTRARRTSSSNKDDDQGEAPAALLGALRRDARRAGRRLPVGGRCRWRA